MAETELLPCPFCGGEARIVEGDESAFVQCEQVKMHRAIWFSGDNTAADQVREEWNTRRPAPAGAEVGVAVKPLEWCEITSPREDGPAEPTGDWSAYSELGEYLVDFDPDDGLDGAAWRAYGDGVGTVGHYHSFDEAKAACQADYEARIRSALLSPPVEPQGEAEPGVDLERDAGRTGIMEQLHLGGRRDRP